MEVKTFGGKKVIIKELSENDLKIAKKWQQFINSFVEENAPLTTNKKIRLKEEKQILSRYLALVKKRKQVHILAESGGKIAGSYVITLDRGRMEHVGRLGIAIKKDWRNVGLGSFLMEKIIKLAKKRLKPPPKVIRLGVIMANKPAFNLYKRFGFRVAAKIPKQIQYKGRLVAEIVMLKEL